MFFEVAKDSLFMSYNIVTDVAVLALCVICAANLPQILLRIGYLWPINTFGVTRLPGRYLYGYGSVLMSFF